MLQRSSPRTANSPTPLSEPSQTFHRKKKLRFSRCESTAHIKMWQWASLVTQRRLPERTVRWVAASSAVFSLFPLASQTP